MTAKTLIKRTALTTLRSGGVFSVAANSRRRRNSLAILCYHGISLRDEHEWLGQLFITPELFRRRMESLRRFRANVLPLGDALNQLAAGSLPARSVALTFDDGFCDFGRHAVPVLKEFGYPCTLYLTTHYSRHRLPIFDLIVPYLLWKSGRGRVSLREFGVAEEVEVQTYEQRRAACSALREKADEQDLNTIQKNEWAMRLASSLGIDFDDILRSEMFQILSEEQARGVHKAGIDIQLHTHRHRTPKTRALFEREITDNSAAIAGITGRKPVHFCYPSGVYDVEFLPWLRDAGVQSATTCVPALARRDSDPLLLPRLLDHSFVSDVEFDAWLCGVYER